ncbi:MAG: hypothetical protein U9Q67_04575, partial [Patescibacteria group bacterium]|nr:hypothetical protein [Patescibacteria group bacterium]
AKLSYYDRDEYITWLEQAAYDELKAVKPDLTIVLHLPSKYSSRFNLKKSKRAYLNGEKEDIAERDIKHQNTSKKEYLRQADKRKTWITLKCISKEGKLKTPGFIHQEIVHYLENKGFFENYYSPDQLPLSTRSDLG